MENQGTNPPIVIDLGKVKKKRVKALKRGEGKLVSEVQQAVEQVRARLGASAAGKEIVPVVVVYRQKDDQRMPRMLPRGLF